MSVRRCLLTILLAWLGVSSPAVGQSPESRTSASMEYGMVVFDGELDPWHILSAELQRHTKAGSAILRGNFARRFGEFGQQLEADVYPRLGPGAYAYLNAGYSPSGLFPRRRFGAEIFTNVPGGLELSLGARRLEFEQTDVNLFTGSVGLYTGNMYVSLRPMLSRSDETGLSGSVLVRRYSGSGDSYLGARVGGGRSVEDDATALDLGRVNWLGGELEGRRTLGGRWGIRGSLGAQTEELSNGRERRRISFSAGLEARF